MNDVARLQQRQEHGLVGLAAGIRLHIGEMAAEQPSWRARWPASRRCRRIRSRRNSACRDSPRHICWSAPSPAPPARRARRCFPRRSARSRCAGGRASAAIASAISGSVSASEALKKRVGEFDFVDCGRRHVGEGFHSAAFIGRWRLPRAVSTIGNCERQESPRAEERRRRRSRTAGRARTRGSAVGRAGKRGRGPVAGGGAAVGRPACAGSALVGAPRRRHRGSRTVAMIDVVAELDDAVGRRPGRDIDPVDS